VSNKGMALMDHELHTVGASALVGVTDDAHIVRVGGFHQVRHVAFSRLLFCPADFRSTGIKLKSLSCLRRHDDRGTPGDWASTGNGHVKADHDGHIVTGGRGDRYGPTRITRVSSDQASGAKPMIRSNRSR
jgi:hypothetical protein